MKGGPSVDTGGTRTMSNKKITREEIKTTLMEMAAKLPATILASGQVVPIKPIQHEQFTENGVKKNRCYCHACGNHYETLSTHSVNCPNCGNNHTVTSHYYWRSYNRSTVKNGEMWVEEYAEGDSAINAIMSFALFTHETTFGPDKEKPIRDLVTTVELSCVGAYCDGGWFVYDVANTKLLKRDSQAEIDILRRVRSCSTPMNIEPVNFTALLALIKSKEDVRSSEVAAKKAKSKNTLLNDMRELYKPATIDEAAMLHSVESTVLYLDSDQGGFTYRVGCPECGQSTLVTVADENMLLEHEHTCPHCGHYYRSLKNNDSYYYRYRESFSKEVVVFENTNLPENDLLMRVFHLTCTMNPPTTTVISQIHETTRYFFGKAITVYDIDKSGKITKGNMRSVPYFLSRYSSHDDSMAMQSQDEMVDVIKKSCLRYSGLIESYGWGDKRYTKYCDFPNITYIQAWYKNPSIEMLLKSPLTNAMKHYMDNQQLLNKGKTLAEVLGFDQSVVNIATKLNLSYNEMVELNSLYKEDNTITVDMFREIRDTRIAANLFVQLKQNYNISFRQALDYMEAVYNHQCIEKNTASTIWYDYLQMATMLHFDLTEKSRKYPGSLKKEHDVAMFASRALKQEIDLQMFQMQAEKNAYYEYTYEKLMVTVPKTPEDVVQEATRQHNCLRSYLQRIRNGDTVVVFIRYKETPDESYVTCEINNNYLVQIKGKYNSNPMNKELYEFISHWTKARGIKMK